MHKWESKSAKFIPAINLVKGRIILIKKTSRTSTSRRTRKLDESMMQILGVRQAPGEIGKPGLELSDSYFLGLQRFRLQTMKSSVTDGVCEHIHTQMCTPCRTRDFFTLTFGSSLNVCVLKKSPHIPHALMSLLYAPSASPTPSKCTRDSLF